MKSIPYFMIPCLLAFVGGCFGEFGDEGKEEVYRDKGDFIMEWGKSSGYEVHEDWSVEYMSYEEEYLNGIFKLPYDISITHKVCGDANAYWDGDGVTMCYEMLDLVAEVFGLLGSDISDPSVPQ